jgi:hypothetical protein
MPARNSHRDALELDGSGGERGIRTPEAGFSRLHTFQACSFNHSDTSPRLYRDSVDGIRPSTEPQSLLPARPC